MRGGTRLTDNKNDMGLSFYIPLVLVVAFMLGCLSVALITVRENVFSLTSASAVSDSDAAKNINKVRKSPVYDDEGLKYRMVSASDLGIGNKSVASSNHAGENKASASDEEKDNEGGLKLPLDHYINFIPHKQGCTAYLTFDDGPSENTEDILDILDFYNVKATFFVIYHENMEDKYKAIVNAGHTIALHSYTHNYSKVYSSESAFFNEMAQISDYIYSVTGVRSTILRFPGGSSNTVSRRYSKGLMPVLKKSVEERGYVYQDWNIDSCDAEAVNTAPDRLLSNIRNSLKDQKTAVILMHDSGKNTRTTVEALPGIIEFFYQNGYAMEKIDMSTEPIHHNW